MFAIKGTSVFFEIAVLGFWLIVYNRANVYIYQNFLKIDVHVIIIEQWNQTVRLYEIKGKIFYSRSNLVTVTVRVPCKEGYL